MNFKEISGFDSSPWIRVIQDSFTCRRKYVPFNFWGCFSPRWALCRLADQSGKVFFCEKARRWWGPLQHWDGTSGFCFIVIWNSSGSVLLTAIRESSWKSFLTKEATTSPYRWKACMLHFRAATRQRANLMLVLRILNHLEASSYLPHIYFTCCHAGSVSSWWVVLSNPNIFLF